MKQPTSNIAKWLPFYRAGVNFYRLIKKLMFPSVLKTEKQRLLSFTPEIVLKKRGDRLNIAHLSTYDNIGGAAMVAFRLHNAYNMLGHDSTMLVGVKSSKDGKVISIANPRKDAYYRAVCEGRQYMNVLSSFNIPAVPQFRDADILHLHNLHGEYFNYEALPGLTRLKPSVWTLHDMQALTGHCAHSLDCMKWETGCGECPMLEAYPALEKDTSALLWKEKRELYSGTDVDIVVPSKWLYDIVKKSILADKDVHLIYNGIDTEVFRPLNKAELREELGIPRGTIVLVTSSVGGMKNPHKGGNYLLDALKRTGMKNRIALVSIGDKDFNPRIDGIDWINTGHLFDEGEIAKWYSVADIFLYPSIADNCPLVVLEAMACGLPVVTFRTGGIPELVEHMKTGYVAEYRDVDDLVRGMEAFISDQELRMSAGERARAVVEKSFTIEKMASSYLELYYRVIGKRAGKERRSA